MVSTYYLSLSSTHLSMCIYINDEQKEFKGKAGSSAKVRLGPSSTVKSIALVGLGKKSAFKSARAVGVCVRGGTYHKDE